MISSLLIANRGEIALRIARACRELGIRTVMVYSTADRDSPALRLADQLVRIGPAAAKRSYLYPPAILEAALGAGVEAVHPGYGFLSEDADFAEMCEAEGLTFVGPPPPVIASLGDKTRARKLATGAGLPVLPGSAGTLSIAQAAKDVADEIGYPVIIKAAAGGGGRGMAVVRDPLDFLRAFTETRASAQAVFGDGRVYVEKYVDTARHVEVQILADLHGNIVSLGERDCSIQRRRQKLIEESPAPGLPAELTARIGEAAVACARAAGYVGAGTFEFLVDAGGGFFFIEANCRIQVEHPVTEMVTGIDLVREQLLIASGRPLSFGQGDIAPRGVSIECRVNTEDPTRGFLPTPGRIEEFVPPGGPFTRVDTHGANGVSVSADYDSLLAKVIVWAPDRDQAIVRMERALSEFRITGRGVCTTIGFLREILADTLFLEARHHTSRVDDMVSLRS
ncbi:acetyl-CoA carboxylase biotin carboxylase subunit [Streptosporangium sp. NBC_01755]|uniref:acetyl-CoA carboxylase biotin carboxylase subunit n=1 Tax=unclassified Streptosporangium TaxID=2632669 RepID=UPI002DDC80B3|nr:MULTISPECIES: acetyl-CoA carboxylase biotin carboxylase subunit [unclassified Streptosporangium]WSA25669.1 acetyl-CoA carboxylase biotin carboxylase subunit [Streptosporangium sp. NBC_01810]WSD02941.1 acetyl-CoA carboxylase biotin carboxylase subunit [Streptosporangium sp. NBC_01755]